jgi:hypothetical protein
LSEGCVENFQLSEEGCFYPFELTLFLTTNQDMGAIALSETHLSQVKDQKIVRTRPEPSAAPTG